MKSNDHMRFVFLLFLGIGLTFLTIINYNLNFNAGYSSNGSKYSNKIYIEGERLKISKVSERIHINNNWSDVQAAGIVTGSGTFSDPYVIEDLVIDAGGSGRGIFIENSNVYVIIENCTVFNWSIRSDTRGGIELSHVTNTKLINNNCSNNYRGSGIYLYNCDNTTISGNTAENNKYGTGIEIYNSDKNTIFANKVNSNWNGIVIYNGDKNTIFANTVNSNWHGIRISGTMMFGAYNISGNTINNNQNGLILSTIYNNTISGNIVNNNNVSGIILDSSHGNTISGNTANNNNGTGISLSRCIHNKVLENTINYNHNGIFLSESDSNIISGNTLSGNDICWEEYDCEGNVFENNDCGEVDKKPAFPIYYQYILIGIIILVLIIVLIIVGRKLSRA